MTLNKPVCFTKPLTIFLKIIFIAICPKSHLAKENYDYRPK